MLQLNSKNIPYQSVQVFLSLVSKSSDIATLSTKLFAPNNTVALIAQKLKTLEILISTPFLRCRKLYDF